MQNFFKYLLQIPRHLNDRTHKILNSYITLLLLLKLLILAIWILYNPCFINEVFLSVVFTKPVYNIKKNNLSLKKLQEEIEQLKSGNDSHNKKDSHDKKDSHQKDDHADKHHDSNQNITIRMMRSSVIPGVIGLYWWLITAIISYGHKIPMVSKLINMLSLWYGRTTWWKMLASLRKVFIVINAIIGVFTVFWITGFSTDNLLAGFYGVGVTYVDMITSFTKRLFNWFFELFDHKIVPKSPSYPSNYNPSWKWWGPKENTWASGNNSFKKIIDLSRNPDYYAVKIDTSSSWGIPNWLWYTGIFVVSVFGIYCVYSLCNDTTILQDLNPFKKDYKGKGVDRSGSSGDISLGDMRTGTPGPSGSSLEAPKITITNPDGVETNTATSIVNGLIAINTGIMRSLNPLNYLPAGRKAFDTFMLTQKNANTYEPSLFPFTEVNPYDSLWHRLQLIFIGETVADVDYRTALQVPATSVYNNTIRVDNVAVAAEVAANLNNNVTTTFLAGHSHLITENPAFGASAWQQASAVERLANLPSTPTSTPSLLPPIDYGSDLLDHTIAWKETQGPEVVATPEPLIDLD